ncbi:rhodanese domain-containing protein CG4456-like isoform X3 [Macrobrachium rosenbergii]|uniref:rhodanese domain-containing protein CG4456-like isoform X3 n=1 Tax=Macrobrachium rosenbergii TaxID=79674 RepID=UPI0034D4DDC3
MACRLMTTGDLTQKIVFVARMNVLRYFSSLNSSRYLVKPSSFTSAPRCLSTSFTLLPDIEFEELKQRVERNDITVIDVRTPKELTQIGMIPNSKNIKVQSFGPDILLPDDKFAEKFGFKKPALDEPIAVICLAGIRARTAQLAMMAVGYSNVRVYVGSMEDWLEKKGPVVF